MTFSQKRFSRKRKSRLSFFVRAMCSYTCTYLTKLKAIPFSHKSHKMLCILLKHQVKACCHHPKQYVIVKLDIATYNFVFKLSLTPVLYQLLLSYCVLSPCRNPPVLHEAPFQAQQF